MTEQFFLLGLLLKIVMTATIVVTATIIVERTGPFIGALIAALPTAAGAVYIILALEHTPAFIAGSAVGSMASNASGTLFAFTYALLAQRRGLIVSIIGAFAVWFLCAGSAAAGELDTGERARPQCDCDRRRHHCEPPVSHRRRQDESAGDPRRYRLARGALSRSASSWSRP